MVQRREHRKHVARGPLEDYIGFHLGVAQHLSFQAFAKRVLQKNLQPEWFAALVVLQRNPGITQVALVRAIQRDKSTVARLVEKLLRQGLISRRTSVLDRRRAQLKLTRAGERALRGYRTHAARHEEILNEAVGAGKSHLLDLLDAIAARFRPAE